MPIEYYDRQGLPMDRDDWMRKIEIWSYKVVQKSTIHHPGEEDITVSTVWLGLDHSFGEGHAPLIFETMVFGGPYDQDWMDRYATESAAIVGHQRMVEAVMNMEGADA